VTRPLATFEVPPGEVAEPIALGLALPPGALTGAARLVDPTGATLAEAALTPLLRWPDGSVAWLLAECVAPPEGGRYALEQASGPPAPEAFPAPLLPPAAFLRIEDTQGGQSTLTTLTETQRHSTPLHTVGRGAGRLGPLDVEVRATHWPTPGLTRLEIVVHNPRAARHEGGLWDLGDPGSVTFRELALHVPSDARWRLQPEPGEPFGPAPVGTALFQASSGGEQWQSPNHMDTTGRIPLAFRGYRLGARHGLRAQPVLRTPTLEVALGEFWQNFPKTLAVEAAALRVALFPAEHGPHHELQGGERKRHTLWLGPPGALAFVASPRRPLQPAAEIAAAGVLDTFAPAAGDAPEVTAHVAQIVDPNTGFAARRELIDEYGWRNWGDFFADHEAVRHTDTTPFVSHYNNQYDCVEACLLWWLRTGDVRWFALADPLARHVVDIDLYHTTEDRAAYGGGQFWHTDHYRPASTSTHRCYAKANAGTGPYGGGPGNEQNYPAGLWLHHLLTGDPWSREAGLELAEWVLRMDDGRRNVLGLADAGPTGAASQTYSPDYHGPGRGAGNSVNALCEAWRHTGEAKYLDAAEALIARCVHPTQDLATLELLDAERRWSYVVFLKYLLKYLHIKETAGTLDAAWRHGRAALLHYARFMVAHEQPSTTHPERLEFVTETWPAQDLRKAQVIHGAAAYVEGDERRAFHTWAARTFDAAFAELRTYPTASLCRPLVLTLHPSIAETYARSHPDVAAPADPTPDATFPPAVPFAPQKARVRAAVTSPSGLIALARRALRPATLRALRAPNRSPFPD
jgi:hypothetical protein